MNRRTLTTMVLLGLAVATALPQIAFAQSNPFPGTWQLNLAKSKYSPGPAPKSGTVKVQEEGQGLKNTATGVGAEGNPVSNTFTMVFDGMPHPEGNPNFDAEAWARVDAYTLINSNTKAGKLVGTRTVVVSPDGKTLTATKILLDATGKLINNIVVYDKLALLPSSIVAQQGTLKQQLVGIWTLVSMELTPPNGIKQQPYGANPKGMLIVDAGGRYAAVYGKSDRPKLKSANRSDVTAQEFGAAALDFNANYGTLLVNEADKTVTNHRENALSPNDEGTDAKATVTLAGDELRFTFTNPATGVSGADFVFRRAP
jgi:Lipocalin-like domain